MKKLTIIALAVLLSISALAFSKNHGNYDLTPDERVERLTSRLGLDESQQQQALQIFTETQAQRLDLHQQMQALREQTRNSINSILTAEQQENFANMGPANKGYRGKCPRGMQ